ncbi:MAG: sensor histidine kinase, partial [Cyanobacteriota bacterium]|nr:sensor histidine kinase [Cyanobacteriota bacterium]
GPGLPFASSEIGRRPLISASGGMGIGLMIVRRFIDAANGRLETGRSVALGGARISLFLPIVR